MYVTLDHIETVAENIRTFWFKPTRRVRYVAGQFIEMYLPHADADSRGQKHWFTLSSSPTEELLSITTKFADRSSTFKQTLAALQPGAQIMLSDPMGDFVLPKDPRVPLVFIAGGIGVTPMRSMIKSLADGQDTTRSIDLLYAASKPAELAFTTLFEQQLGKRFIPFVKTAPAGWQGQTGSLTAERILDIVQPTPECLFYLSGPQPMTEALVKDLRAYGIARQAITTDYFPGYLS